MASDDVASRLVAPVESAQRPMTGRLDAERDQVM